MNGQLLFDTLLVWSAQICLLVAAGAFAIRFLQHPKARLWAWQGLLVALLALPWIEPWRTPLAEAIPAVVEDTGAPGGIAQALGSQGHHWSSADVLWILAFGVALRLLWIVAGLARLRRYRMQARPFAAPPVPFGSGFVRWYLNANLASPVTFGWPRASILLPAHFEQMELPMREAIACHELLHVVRRDWLIVMCEEMIRAAFWFHPAVWFALSRIQLEREQVVDREVIRLTQDRDHYLDALVAVAAQKIQPDLAPAPLFLKKRHLARRVAAVLQEVSMSRPRMYAVLAAVCSAVLLAARLSVWLIPFTLPAQVQPDDAGVTVDAGAKILHRTPIHIPADVTARGTLVVEATLNAKGEVSDARILSGPDELRKAVLASVLDWHYAAGPSSVEIKINVGGTDAASSAPVLLTSNAAQPAPAAARTPAPSGPTYRVDPTWANGQFPATLTVIKFSGLNADARQALRSVLLFHKGDTVRSEDLARIAGALEEFDSHLRMTIQVAGNGEFALLIAPAEARLDSRTAVGFPPPEAGTKRLRVGGNVESANLINKVVPKYPLEAKQQRIQGTVSYAALIGTDGHIKDLNLISGEPVLADAALEALKQWTYRPTLLNGNAVEVVTQIDVNFTLSQ